MELPTTNPSSSLSPSAPWRILEFYSGIGGMRYSLMCATGVAAAVVEAFEINDVANDVYQFNFSHRPHQGNIQSLTPVELDKYGANAWLLSPPCQPYTRQGLQKDSADARASSFIMILEIIPSMQNPPVVMFVENVVGFETSDTHRQLMDILDANNYITQEFILSPMQFGIPYSRPRYFCLAKRKPLSFINSSFNGLIRQAPIPLGTCISGRLTDKASQPNLRPDELDLYCSPIKNFLQSSCSSTDSLEDAESNLSEKPMDYNKKHHEDVQDGYPTDACASELVGDDHSPNGDMSACAKGNYDVTELLGEHAVPLTLIERWGNAMDVVFPDSRRCCCFTKSYYRYVKGTGSLLATTQPTKMSESMSLKDLGLRYFTPREICITREQSEYSCGGPPASGALQGYISLHGAIKIEPSCKLMAAMIEVRRKKSDKL